MITVKLPYKTNKIELNCINNIRRVYSSCYRFSFNRFERDKLNEKQIRLLVKDKFKINSWLTQCSIKDAEGLFKSRLVSNDKTKIIFGGRLNLSNYLKKSIDKNTYRNFRLRDLNIQGEQLQKGNRLFSLDIISGNKITFKPSRDVKIDLELPKLRKSIKRQLYKLEELSKDRKITYTVRLSDKFVYITFDEKLVADNSNYKGFENRLLGIDLNPNYIGYSIIETKSDDTFKVIYKEVVNLKQLTIKSNKSSNHKYTKYLINKHQYELIESIKHIIAKAKQYKVSKVIVEELNIKSRDSKKGKVFNRLTNNKWNRNLIISNLKKRCNIDNIKAIEVLSYYNSFIGNINYGSRNTPDMIASSIEIARRGINKFKKGWIYPQYKNADRLNELWKQTLDWSLYTWIDLFKHIKNSKLTYRIPLNEDLKSFSLKSYKSKIKLYKNFI